MNTSSLYDIPTGRSAHILRVPGGDAMSRRLLDIGFTPGTSVTCLYKAPGGDPARLPRARRSDRPQERRCARRRNRTGRKPDPPGGERMGLTASSTGTHAREEMLTVLRPDEDTAVVALAGNPNVGKSTVFNALDRHGTSIRETGPERRSPVPRASAGTRAERMRWWTYRALIP